MVMGDYLIIVGGGRFLLRSFRFDGYSIDIRYDKSFDLFYIWDSKGRSVRLNASRHFRFSQFFFDERNIPMWFFRYIGFPLIFLFYGKKFNTKRTLSSW